MVIGMKMPCIANDIAVPAQFITEKLRSRNRPRGTRGSACRRSHARKAMKSAMPAPITMGMVSQPSIVLQS